MGITRFGSKEISRALDRYSNEVMKKVRRVVSETTLLLQAEARARAPVDTGDLVQSIQIRFENNGLTGIVTVGAHYAIWIEYGTGIYAKNGNGRKTPWSYYNPKFDQWVTTNGHAAQPFWFPAIDIAKDYYFTEMRKLFGK